MNMMETGYYGRENQSNDRMAMTEHCKKMVSENSVSSKEPDTKKRKLDFDIDINTVNKNGTILTKDGIPTPGESMEVDMNNDRAEGKSTSSTSGECPCGHLHGSDGGLHHDIHAVGLASVPLLRGPD